MDTNKGLNNKPKTKEKMHYNLCTQTCTWEDIARTQRYSQLRQASCKNSVSSCLCLVVYLGSCPTGKVWIKYKHDDDNAAFHFNIPW